MLLGSLDHATEIANLLWKSSGTKGPINGDSYGSAQTKLARITKAWSQNCLSNCATVSLLKKSVMLDISKTLG